MPRFAANLGFLWPELPLLGRIAAAAGAGFRAIELHFPYDVPAIEVRNACARHGLTLVDWTLDTHDWRGDDAESMFGATRDALEDGTVVLAHDGIGPGARRPDSRETLRYVELVGPYARRRGLALKALR